MTLAFKKILLRVKRIRGKTINLCVAFDEKLNDRIREALSDISMVEEKRMFGGICYMVNGKMCLGVVGDAMMCRIDHDIYEEVLERT